MKIAPFTKTYEDRMVLDFPGTELEPGLIYAVIGANGSGKSTFARILAGTLPADKKGKRHDAKTLGFMPQKNYGYRMSVRHNLLLNSREKALADRLKEELQLSHLARKRADRLSGGETARMALARLMMRNYDLVILDEPTAAMDMETTLLAEQKILEYVRSSGCAMLLVTHSLRQAERLADRVLYFHRGKLLEAGPKEQMLEHPQKEETRQFLEFYGA